MSTPRPIVGAAAAFFAATVSVDPESRPASPHAVVAASVSEVAGPRSVVEVTGAPAPPDVAVEVVPDARIGHRVVVRRQGYLVSLRNEVARSAGKDWAALGVAASPGKGEAAGRLIWETTRVDALETTRGVVMLAGDGASLSAELQAARPPEPAVAWESAHARCAGQHDGLAGFTVLCRFATGVRVSGVANVTGARSLDDAWLVPGPSPLVRLDLPRSPGGAEGRVIGLTKGGTGVVLCVEASFAEGEVPALVLHEAERSQPGF
jgi:hypothetical protein